MFPATVEKQGTKRVIAYLFFSFIMPNKQNEVNKQSSEVKKGSADNICVESAYSKRSRILA